LNGLDDKKNVRFGYVDKNALYDGVSKTFNEYQNNYEKTNIIDIKDDQRKKLNKDTVGKKKDPLQGYVNKDIAFGVSTGEQKEGWNCGQCIIGDYKVEDRLPDKDLGTTRNLKNKLYKNDHNDGHVKDPDRVFGIPSIRNDVDKRGTKSVADPLNYGGEANANELLKPKE